MTARILVVDDEPNIVLSLEFLLRQEGYEIATAPNGGEALRLAAAFRPNLVVLDVMLPVVDGFEVCRLLRADPAQALLKVILLTARGRAAEMERAVEVGANTFMTKPFATRDLIAKIRELLAADPALPQSGK